MKTELKASKELTIKKRLRMKEELINHCLICDNKLKDIGEEELLMCVDCANKVNNVSKEINGCKLDNEYYCNNPTNKPNCYKTCDLYTPEN